jgi:hypothetical protein
MRKEEDMKQKWMITSEGVRRQRPGWTCEPPAGDAEMRMGKGGKQ